MKILLEGTVLEHWKGKHTYPVSENIILQVDMGGFTKVIETDINLKTTRKSVRNFYNVSISLPRYHGVKTGQKIKIILEDE